LLKIVEIQTISYLYTGAKRIHHVTYLEINIKLWMYIGKKHVSIHTDNNM